MAKTFSTFKLKPLLNKAPKRKRKIISTKFLWENQLKISKINKKYKWKEDVPLDKKYSPVLSSDSLLLKYFVEAHVF